MTEKVEVGRDWLERKRERGLASLGNRSGNGRLDSIQHVYYVCSLCYFHAAFSSCLLYCCIKESMLVSFCVHLSVASSPSSCC